MTLTPDNYFSREADIAKMSNSQFGGWCRCPSAQAAKLRGEYDDLTGAKVFGNYVDRAVTTPELLEAWWRDNLPTLQRFGLASKKKGAEEGTKNADLRNADAMIARIAADPLFQEYLSGERQRIIEFEFGGVAWKCAVDVLNLPRKRIVDLKTAGQSLHGLEWHDERDIWQVMAERAGEEPQNGRRVPWYEARNYWRQLALYRYAVDYETGIACNCYLAAVRKPSRDGAPVDLDVFAFRDRDRMAAELRAVQELLPQVLRWKSGDEEPPRCGSCDWCLSTKTASVVEAKSYS